MCVFVCQILLDMSAYEFVNVVFCVSVCCDVFGLCVFCLQVCVCARVFAPLHCVYVVWLCLCLVLRCS